MHRVRQEEIQGELPVIGEVAAKEEGEEEQEDKNGKIRIDQSGFDKWYFLYIIKEQIIFFI